ncbi:MAG: single-stranded DNA-binding protein [Deltaproteobacteria bacterium]|nr:single-stranded DNA-binding protein [Deltaproteobacteria bacterium]
MTSSLHTTAPATTRSRPSAASERTESADEVGCNLAVLWGRCSAGVEVRTLDSGRRLASLAVRTSATAPPRRRPGSRAAATSVPVTVWDPPAWLETLEADEPLVVVGTIRRRFFATRAGGRGAKAEVEAISVARPSRAQLERAFRRAADALDVLI